MLKYRFNRPAADLENFKGVSTKMNVTQHLCKSINFLRLIFLKAETKASQRVLFSLSETEIDFLALRSSVYSKVSPVRPCAYFKGGTKSATAD